MASSFLAHAHRTLFASFIIHNCAADAESQIVFLRCGGFPARLQEEFEFLVLFGSEDGPSELHQYRKIGGVERNLAVVRPGSGLADFEVSWAIPHIERARPLRIARLNYFFTSACLYEQTNERSAIEIRRIA